MPEYRSALAYHLGGAPVTDDLRASTSEDSGSGAHWNILRQAQDEVEGVAGSFSEAVAA